MENENTAESAREFSGQLNQNVYMTNDVIFTYVYHKIHEFP